MESGTSCVPGVAYFATGTTPSVVTPSVRIGFSNPIPATAYAVAIGGWACVTAITCGFSSYTRRCILISEEGLELPCSTFPVRSSFTNISGFIKPLDTPVGVAQMAFGPTLQLILPSFAATKPLAYIRRPMSIMAFLASKSDIYFTPLIVTIFSPFLFVFLSFPCVFSSFPD